MNKTFFALLVMILLNACGSGKDSPKGVAAVFTESVAYGKIDQAKALATEPTGKVLDFMVMSGKSLDPNFKFRFLKDSIAGNEAWVHYKNTSGKEEVLYLVKLDGKWKVHMDLKK